MDNQSSNPHEQLFSGKTVKGSDVIAAEQMRDADIADDLELKESWQVAPEKDTEYLRQIAEPQGLQTCFPTSLLNGSVHQGVLSAAEAQAIQERFRTDLAGLFGRREDIDAAVFNARAAQIAQTIQVSTARNIELLTMAVKGLEPESVAKIILQELNKGNVLVGGDAIHAVLITGYEENGKVLVIRDPKMPDVIARKPAGVFAQDLLNGGETWLTVIPKFGI